MEIPKLTNHYTYVPKWVCLTYGFSLCRWESFNQTGNKYFVEPRSLRTEVQKLPGINVAICSPGKSNSLLIHVGSFSAINLALNLTKQAKMSIGYNIRFTKGIKIIK